MPLIFFEPEALLFIMEKERPVLIGLKSPGKLSASSGVPGNTSLFEKSEQDGIEVFIDKKIQLPKNSQITVSLETGLLGRKLKAQVTPRITGPGFMGTRY
jgi:hypothetical protein